MPHLPSDYREKRFDCSRQSRNEVIPLTDARALWLLPLIKQQLTQRPCDAFYGVVASEESPVSVELAIHLVLPSPTALRMSFFVPYFL
ncbi:MAG: hypothetical protein IKS36_07710 [Bacteroidales bacterium]|nr:hypothetical protein [Bacteroidales bacterium]